MSKIKIKIIEKARGMEEKGALKLLEFHKGLREVKIARLKGQLKETEGEHGEIEKEISRLIRVLSDRIKTEVEYTLRKEQLDKLIEEEEKKKNDEK